MPSIIRSMRPRRLSRYGVLGAAFLVLAGSELTAGDGGSIAAHAATRASSKVATGREGVPGFGRVFLIVGENASAGQVTARTAPYLTNSIRPEAAWLTRYFAVAERSLGNYVAMVSG